MKKNVRLGVLSFALAGLMAACSTSNDVASKRSIQKRKYNKGFFIDFNKKTLGNSNTEEIATNDSPATNEVSEKVIENKGITKEILYVEEVQTVASPTTKATELKKEEVSSVESNNVSTKSEEAIVATKTRDNIKNIRSLKQQMKSVVKEAKKEQKKNSNSSDDMTILYYVLAFFFPPLAVGLVTDWDVKQVIISVLLTALCGLPGIIHAFIVVSRNT